MPDNICPFAEQEACVSRYACERCRVCKAFIDFLRERKRKLPHGFDAEDVVREEVINKICESINEKRVIEVLLRLTEIVTDEIQERKFHELDAVEKRILRAAKLLKRDLKNKEGRIADSLLGAIDDIPEIIIP